MAVTSQMNIIGDTLRSIAGDIATDTSMSNSTRISAKDTCTIQLVQDWLELEVEVLDEPVKHETEEPAKLNTHHYLRSLPTCTIQLVQDWLELEVEVLDEPVKHETEEPAKLNTHHYLRSLPTCTIQLVQDWLTR